MSSYSLCCVFQVSRSNKIQNLQRSYQFSNPVVLTRQFQTISSCKLRFRISPPHLWLDCIRRPRGPTFSQHAVAKILTGVSFWRAMFAVWWNGVKKGMSVFFFVLGLGWAGCSGMKVRWNDARVVFLFVYSIFALQGHVRPEANTFTG